MSTRFDQVAIPVGQLVREKVEPGVGEDDEDLQKDEDHHEEGVDAVGDVMTHGWRRVVHLHELDQLHEETGRRGQPEDDGSDANRQTSVALKLL